MADPTLTATAEPDNMPPRVRIDVTDTGSPEVTEVTVLRTDADGSQTPVRSPDGDTLTLTTSGSDRVGVVYDYEPAYGQVVTYRLQENTGAVAATTLPVADPWLIHPGVPTRSMPIKVATLPAFTRAVRAGVHMPMGRSTAVVITDGRRKAPQGVLELRTDTLGEQANLLALLDDVQTLMLNVPAGLGWGMTKLYVAVGDLSEERPFHWGAQPVRYWSLPLTVVSRPAGGAQSHWTLGDLDAAYATLGDVKAAYATLADIQANTPSS